MAESHDLVREISEALPLSEAMPELVRPREGRHPLLLKRVQSSRAAAEVKAGLLLYLDELDLSHRISQDIETPTGSYWHAIMHRREGDFSNSKYWLRRAGRHPFLSSLPGFDPERFVNDCQNDLGDNKPELLQAQRKEWKALMDHILSAMGPS